MNRICKRIALLAGLCCLAGCAATERSELTTNSGVPLSTAMQAYRVDRYVLRNDIDPESRSLAGSVEVHFTALASLPVLELDFEGLTSVD